MRSDYIEVEDCLVHRGIINFISTEDSLNATIIEQDILDNEEANLILKGCDEGEYDYK